MYKNAGSRLHLRQQHCVANLLHINTCAGYRIPGSTIVLLIQLHYNMQVQVTDSLPFDVEGCIAENYYILRSGPIKFCFKESRNRM